MSESSLELSPAANRELESHISPMAITWKPLFPQGITSYVHSTLGGQPCVCGSVRNGPRNGFIAGRQGT